MNSLSKSPIHACRALAFIAAILLIAGCATSAGDTAGATQTAAVTEPATGVAEAEDKERLICRTIKPTGSRFGSRTCLTQKEWSRLTEHSKRETDKLQRTGLGAQPTGGGGD